MKLSLLFKPTNSKSPQIIDFCVEDAFKLF